MSANEASEKLRENLDRVRATMYQACDRAGRDPAEVRLVAVTKYVDLEIIQVLLDLGARDLGENRVQQLTQRAQVLGASPAGALEPVESLAPRWHMIGHLQRNKARALLQHARILHSLDSPRLVHALEKQAARLDLTIDAFLEFNVAGEAAKSGAPVSDAMALTDAVAAAPHIRLHGLMTMPPFDPDPEAARPHFARLRELLTSLQESGAVGPDCVHLSMGMTIDYAVAIEEGATFVRVGSALFEGVNLRPPSADE
jgi:pyridoxal phosphate enzyme (YggS family)